MTKTKFEPVQIFIDKDSIEQAKQNLEKYIDFLNEFALDLQEDGITLDEKLLDIFSQFGHPIISHKLMEIAEENGTSKLLYNELSAGATRKAARYGQTFTNLHNLQHKTGHGLHSITILNGRAVPRGNVLQEIIDSNTITLKSPEVQELHQRLTSFVKSYNELQKYIKEVHPECEDLKENIIAGMTEQHYFMGKINREDCYMVVEPYTSDSEPDLVVNPLYFKHLK